MYCDWEVHSSGRKSMGGKGRQVVKDNLMNTFYELATPDGICIRYYRINSADPGKVILENGSPGVQLSYTLNGNKSYRVRNGSRELASFKKHEYNYLFLTSGQTQLTWQGGEQVEMFEVTISPEMMFNYLPEDHPLFVPLQQSLQQRLPGVLNDVNLPVKARSTSILYDILYCPLEGRYKQLYIRSKVGELLSLELGSYERQTGGGDHKDAMRQPRLKQKDIDRMHQVKDIILSDFSKSYSLIDLAQQVGTNDSYLKRHFKEVFGTTVYGFIQDAKMESAKKLLQEGHNVSGTAFMMGYKHAVHFTRAFKKYFSISPNQVTK